MVIVGNCLGTLSASSSLCSGKTGPELAAPGAGAPGATWSSGSTWSSSSPSSSSFLRARFASVSSRRGVSHRAGMLFFFCAAARFGGGFFGWAAAEGPAGGVGTSACSSEFRTELADGPAGGADGPREDRDRDVDGVFAHSRSGGTDIGVSDGHCRRLWRRRWQWRWCHLRAHRRWCR